MTKETKLLKSEVKRIKSLFKDFGKAYKKVKTRKELAKEVERLFWRILTKT
jgi:hypothetical protein